MEYAASMRPFLEACKRVEDEHGVVWFTELLVALTDLDPDSAVGAALNDDRVWSRDFRRQLRQDLRAGEKLRWRGAGGGGRERPTLYREVETAAAAAGAAVVTELHVALMLHSSGQALAGLGVNTEQLVSVTGERIAGSTPGTLHLEGQRPDRSAEQVPPEHLADEPLPSSASAVSRRTPRTAIGAPQLPPRRALALIIRQKEQGEALLSSPPVDHHVASSWFETTRAIVQRAFGEGHRNIRVFHSAGLSLMNMTGPNDVMAAAYLEERLASLPSLIDQLRLQLEDEEELAETTSSERAEPSSAIFVVHGRDVALREQVVRFLEKATKKEVVVLHEQASGGRTLVEKVEHHARRSSFAVVLMTADDIGAQHRQAGETDEQLIARLNPRARQNVILELGYFIAHLGRAHVAVILEPGVEKPSDMDGIVYIAADKAGAWRASLARELEAAEFEVGRSVL